MAEVVSSSRFALLDDENEDPQALAAAAKAAAAAAPKPAAPEAKPGARLHPAPPPCVRVHARAIDGATCSPAS